MRKTVLFTLLSLALAVLGCDDGKGGSVDDTATGDLAQDSRPQDTGVAPGDSESPDQSDAEPADTQRADSTSPDTATGPDTGDAGTSDTSPPTQPNECANMDAAWVFCSSFEEGNKDVWDDYDGNPDATNQLLESPGPFELQGNHVMRLYPPPGRGGADLVKVLPTQHDKLYARWYMKWDANYDFSAANHGSGLHAGNRNYLGQSDNRPDGSDFFTAWLEPDANLQRMFAYSYYRGMYMDCANPSGACWGDHFPCMIDEGATYCEKPQHRETIMPPVMEANRWYCVEMMLDAGTPTQTEADADGQLNWWIDGVAIGPWTDLWLRTTADLQITILWLNLFHHGDHADAGIMFDNVVVSTERVGCPGGAP